MGQRIGEAAGLSLIHFGGGQLWLYPRPRGSILTTYHVQCQRRELWWLAHDTEVVAVVASTAQLYSLDFGVVLGCTASGSGPSALLEGLELLTSL